jgi:uncharacterized protein (TIRG00374 family)
MRRWRDRWKHGTAALAGLVIGGVFVYFSLRHVQLDQVSSALRDSNYWWAIPSFALVAVAAVLRAIRWRFVFSKETRPSTWPVLEASIIGQFLNNVLPARAGDAGRVVLLGHSAKASRAEAAATVVAERAFDVVCLLVLLLVFLPWLPPVSWVTTAAVIAGTLALALVAVGILLFVFGDRPLRFMLRPLARLGSVGLDRTHRIAESLHRGAASLHRPALAFVAFALTLASWVVLGLSAWILTFGFSLHVSLFAGLLVVVALGLASSLPAAPGGIGVFEGAVLVALKSFSVPKADALSYAIVLHALYVLPYIAVGAVLLHLRTARGGRRKEALL